ncbi:TPA: hypothetical protein HA274_00400 [Candidatus Bathyarchaeota archaeon]|nr:hypothetical protein [Candidatus Bathyarchaeota archaeon]
MDAAFSFFFKAATPTVVMIIVANITTNTISGKTSDPGTPEAKGREAKTAAASPRGSMIVTKVSMFLEDDLTNDNLTARNRRPKKTKHKSKAKSVAVNDEKLKSIPVKTKKNERIRKLI